MKKLLIPFLALVLSVAGVQAYTVVEGDYLSKIAQNANLSLSELIKLNPQVEDPNLIYIGQEISLGGEEMTLGGTTPIAGATYYLAGAGISSTATSIVLQSFTLPQTGYEILDGDLSDTFYLTLEPGSRTRQEIISCTTVAQSATNDTATVSGCVRGLKPISPYSADSDYAFTHAGGSQVILSDPPQLFNQYVAKANNEWITGTWGFSAVPTTTDECTATTEFCTKSYIDNQVNQGAATSTESVAGIAELATRIENASSTPWGSTEPHVQQSQHATSTPSANIATDGLWDVWTENDGKLNQSFIDTSEALTWTGTFGVTGQVDLPGALANIYTNYLGGSFNLGYNANTLENATGTLNLLGDQFNTGNATTTGSVSVGELCFGSSCQSGTSFKGYATTTPVTITNSVNETSLGSFTLAGNSLSTSNGVRITIPITDLDLDGTVGATDTLHIRLKFNGNEVAAYNSNDPGAAITNLKGNIVCDLWGHGLTNQQKGICSLYLDQIGFLDGSSHWFINNVFTGEGNEDSTSDLTVSVTAKFPQTPTGSASNSLITEGFIVEIIK